MHPFPMQRPERNIKQPHQYNQTSGNPLGHTFKIYACPKWNMLHWSIIQILLDFKSQTHSRTFDKIRGVTGTSLRNSGSDRHFFTSAYPDPLLLLFLACSWSLVRCLFPEMFHMQSDLHLLV